MSNNSFKVKNSLVLTPVDLATLVSPQAGDVACDINDGNKLKRYNAASSSWVAVGDLEGPASATNEAIARFDGTTGKLVKSGTGTITSAGAVAGLTGLTSSGTVNATGTLQGGNVQISTNTITTTSGNLTVTSNGTADVIIDNDVSIVENIFYTSQNNTTTGSNVSLAIPTTAFVRLTGSGLTSVDMIAAASSEPGSKVTYTNATGAAVTLNNLTGATAANQILTGTGLPYILADGATVDLIYDNTSQKWKILGGSNAASISNTPSGNLAATDVQSALNELQGDIDTQVVGPASSTDLAIARFNGTTGKLIQSGTGTITTAGAIAGLTGISTSGTATFSGAVVNSSNTANTQSGSNVNLTNATTAVTRLTNAALSSIGGYGNSTAGRRNVIINATGNDVTVINEDATVTAANRIVTGTGADFVLKNGASIEMIYNTTTARHQVIGGVGGSGGVGGVDILFVQDFESASLTGFTQTGLSLSQTDPLKGKVSARLTHQTGTSPTNDQFFKQTISVAEKFRNKNVTIKLNIKSAASAGNVLLTVRDETNATDLVSNEQLPVSNAIGGAVGQASFDLPSNCSSLSYEVRALPEAGSPVTIVDDVIAEITSVVNANAVLVQESDSTVRVDTANGYGSASGNKIRRFANIRDQLGSDITYVQDAVNGDRFVVNTSGVYHISSTEAFNAAQFFGITKNSSSLNNSIVTLPANERLAMEVTATSGYAENAAWTGVLDVGDIIRVQGDSGAATTNTDRCTFTISKQSSLKQVSVNPNSKITIPTSELRMEGASTRGSTATAIVRFDNIAKIRGDAFEVLSDSVLGTRIVMKKKGKLDIGVSLYGASAGGQRYAITLNQTNLTTATAIPVNEVLSISSGANLLISSSWSGDVALGDIIRVAGDVNPSNAITGNSLNLFFQEQDISVSVTNTLPQFSESDSSVRVDTANGYGSTGTRIRRFSNVRENIGGDIEYVPSAVNGDSFVVKSAGIYHVSYTERSAGMLFGISLNAASSDLSTVFASLPVTNRLAEQAASDSGNVSWQGYLNAGDVIRPHTSGAAATNDRVLFTISKVGKPNVTGVDVTPFVNVPQPEVEYIQAQGATGSGSTATRTRRFTTVLSNTNKGILRYDSDAVNGTTITVLKNCKVDIHWQDSVASSGAQMGISKNADGATNFTLLPASQKLAQDHVAVQTTTDRGRVTTTAILVAGDVIRMHHNGSFTNTPLAANDAFLSITATAASDSILTPSESFSTDTASLTYAPSSLYNLTTLANAPVGTFITFTYAANTNTRTQTTTAPTQTTDSMNVNGIQLFTRAYNAASTAGNPAAFAIQIGKGLKGKSLDLYKSVGKVLAGSLDLGISGTTEYGVLLKDYNEITGVLTIDAGFRQSNGNNTHILVFSDVTTQNNGYLVINASKSPALTGVPLVQPRIATIKDVKASGTAGGTATAGAYQTRTLNTLEDPSGIVTSLASNQFTLPAGEYYIEASAPVRSASESIQLHKSRIQNITDASPAILSDSGFAYATPGSSESNTQSNIKGTINIASPKTFELQHRVSVTGTTLGFGGATSFGDSETYAQVKITKIK